MAAQANTNPPLQSGTQLDKYRIQKVLASGGFSIVYLAHDENEAPVAIKEYRLGSQDPARFNDGLRCFLEEGRALAGLSHPNLVRVLNFFRANDTVYLVMRYERGRTLLEHIRNRRGALDELWIRNTFAQLLNGLREVHSNKLLHLDIKPANVYIRNDGAPVLIDFGAARQTLAGGGMKLPPTYTPGFASPEQHADREMLGPWSDIYSVGATIYATLAGEPPPPADERLENDALTPARRAWRGKYSKELLDTIDWCLRVFHFERPQSVFMLQKALTGEKPPASADHTVVKGLRSALLRMRGSQS
jgi:serine/threonine protein kinase